MKKIKINWRHQSIGVRDTAKRLIDNEFNLDFRDGKNRSGTNLFQPTDQRTVQLSWPRIESCSGLRMEADGNGRGVEPKIENDSNDRGNGHNLDRGHLQPHCITYLLLYGRLWVRCVLRCDFLSFYLWTKPNVK